LKKIIVLVFLCTSLLAQSQTKELTLKNEILVMDSLLFKVAYNQCDTMLFKKIISDDIEFYDDRSGLNTSKQLEINSLKEKCAAIDNMTRVLRNCTIDKLGDYGAVQIGEHEFVKKGIVVGSANFIHVWERTTAGWRLKRIISYEHASTHK
jgi:hypothetical protein